MRTRAATFPSRVQHSFIHKIAHTFGCRQSISHHRTSWREKESKKLIIMKTSCSPNKCINRILRMRRSVWTHWRNRVHIHSIDWTGMPIEHAACSVFAFIILLARCVVVVSSHARLLCILLFIILAMNSRHSHRVPNDCVHVRQSAQRFVWFVFLSVSFSI